MEGAMKTLARFLSSFESTLASALVVFLTILLSVQIVNRYVFQTSLIWVEEIARISFVWMIYFAVAGAARENRHVRVGIIDLFLSPRALRVVNLIADAVVFAFSLVVVWLGIALVRSSIRFGDRSPVTEIPMSVIYAVIPICFALIAYRVASSHLRKSGSAGADPGAEVLPSE
jgi:TRAP-type C4-dicarboxylate transport system permease small subunit